MINPMPEWGNIATSVSYFQSYHIPVTHRILDIGTNLGSFVHQLHGLGYVKTIGTEVYFDAISYGLKEYPDLRGQILHYGGRLLPFRDNSFDAVTMFDVLEHMPQLDTYLCEVKRILKPDGRLIFQTPNMMTNIPWEILHNRSLTYWRSYHCSLQTLPSLRRLLRQVGFTEVRIEKHSLMSDYNLDRARRVLGVLGPVLIRVAAFFPLFFYPNFWGSCRKATNEMSQSS